ncbi:unnamed protein product [Dicrocoelium dendriticum]|nr:unnamed protein product [Dicrocoelium dendriticum]
MTLYFAALVLYFFRKYDKAREYIQRALKANLLLNEALCLHGWIDLASTDETVRKKAVRFFEDASNDDTPTNLCCLMAKARYFQLFNSCVPALELMNVTIVKFPKFIPALIEKMHLQIILNDWEQAMDAAQRCLVIDAHSIEALKCQVLYYLCYSGNLSEARKKLGELEMALEHTEPHYPQHRYIIAKSFSVLCGRDPVFLQKLAQISERAIELDTGNHQFPIAHGRVLLLLGRYKEAAKQFYSTLEFDDTSVTGLCGTLHCLLAQDNLKEASAQLEFLKELQPTIGKSAELCYLTAVLGRRQSIPAKKITAHLDEAIDLHFRAIEGVIRNLEYYEKLNPDFLLHLVREYMLHAPQQPPGSFHMSRTDLTGQKDVTLIQCLRVLDYLVNVVPGHQEAQYLRAKVYYLSGDITAALSVIKTCLSIDPTLVEAHILSAQIHLYQSDLKMAEQALETGLSYNFEVHNHPLYQLVRARLLLKQGSAKAAVQLLKQTISSLNAGNATCTGKRFTVADGSTLSVADRLSLSLELADAHRTLGEFPEATKVLQDAQMSYTGGPESGRIIIAMADLALSQAHGGDLSVSPEREETVRGMLPRDG